MHDQKVYSCITRRSTGISFRDTTLHIIRTSMSEICKRHDIHYHSYADDTQLYVHYDRNCDISMKEAITKLEYCITELGQWMTHNWLKLNQDKTEWLIFNGGAISRNVTLTVGEHNIKQSAHIRSHGVKLDPEITIEPQIGDVCKSAYYHLRRINKIRKYLTEDSTKTLVHSLVPGRLDYCNSLYSGLTSKATHRLESAQNSAARVITKKNIDTTILLLFYISFTGCLLVNELH